MKNLLFIFILLLSGFAMAQTTVTLEDQCNCEVLSGTAVTAPGMTTPTGADLGDIYVNTNTGTIYFWDGSSWELTSTDSQQLQTFTFDNTTGELLLTLENGGTASVLLPLETLTALTLNGNSLEYGDENGDTNVIPLNVGNLALGADGNSLNYTNEAGALTNIPLNVGTLTFLPATRELTYTDEVGTPTVITLPAETITRITGVSATGNAIGVYENENGDSVTINETITSISDTGDGNVTFTNEAGGLVTVSKSDITANPDGTYTFTNNDGTDVIIDTNGLTVSNLISGNRIATLTQADGSSDDIEETITSMTDAGDGNVTFRNESGATQTVAKSEITDNLDGTFTFDNGDGTPITFVGTDDQNAAEVALSPNLDVDGDSVDETTVQDALTDLANSSSDNQSLTGANLDAGNQLVIGIERGSSATADLSALNETVVAGTGAITVDDDGNGNYTVNSTDPDEDETNELTLVGTGAPTVTPTNSGVTYVDDAAGQLYVYDGTTWNQVGGSSSPDLDPDPNNEIQDLSISGDALSLSNDPTATPIDLSVYRDNTDNQVISSTDGSVTVTPSGTDYDLSVTAADGTETVVQSGNSNISVSGDGSSGSPYQISGTDLDEQNATEVALDTPFDVDGDTVNEANVQEALEDLAANSSDNQQISSSVVTANETVDIDLQRGGTTQINIQDADSDPNNEIQNAAQVVFDDTTSGLGETDVQAAIDALAAGSTDNQTLTTDGNPGNIGITGGNTQNINVNDADADANNELQDLNLTGDILTVTNPATGGNEVDLSGYTNTDSQTLGIVGDQLSITGGNTIAVPTADGTETVVQSGNANITVNGDGSSATPYLISSTDLDEQNATQVALDTPFDVDGDATNETNVQEALEDLAANSSDNQQISSSVATANETVNINLERGGTTQINIQDADADPTNENQTVSAGTGITVNQTGQNFEVVNAAPDQTVTLADGGSGNVVVGGTYPNLTVDVPSLDDADADVTNELTLIGSGAPTVTPSNSGVTYVDDVAGQLYVYDGTTWNAVGGNATPDLDGDPNNEIQTLTSTDGSVTLTQTGDDYDLSVAAADGTETVVQSGNANVTVTGDGSSGDPYRISSTDNVDDADSVIGNEYNTGISFDGTDLTVTDGGGNQSVDISGLDTDDQDIGTDGTAGNISIDDGSTLTLNVDDADANATNEIQTLTSTDGSVTLTQTGDDYNLSVAAADGSETIVNGAGINTVTGDGTSGNPYVVTGTEVDGDITNEIQDLGIAGDQLSITGGNTVTIPTADGTETIVNAGTNVTVTGDGSAATPYVVGVASLDDADANPSNEIQTLTSTDGSVTLTQTGDDYNLSVAAADGSETIVNGAGINSVTGNGTSGNPYVVTGTEVDGDITNELTFVDSGTPAATGTSGTNAGETYVDTTTGQLYVYDGTTWQQVGGNASPDADPDPNNEIQTITSTDGSVTLTQTGNDYNLSVAAADGTETVVQSGNANVTVTGDGSSGNPYLISSTDNVDDADANATNEIQDLDIVGDQLSITGGNTITIPVSDGSETIVNGGIDIDVTGNGTSGNPYVVNNTFTEVDGDISNEIQTLTSTDGSVTLTQTGNDYNLSVAAADGTETIVNAGTNVTVTGDGSVATPYVVGVASLDDADSNPNNEIQAITSTDGSVTLTQTGNDYNLSVAAADGSETVVNGAGINTVTGNGTSGNPYVVTGTEIDGDITNEIQTLTSTDGSVTLTQTGDDYNLSVAAADGTETVVQSGNANVTVTGDGSSGDPYRISSTDNVDDADSVVGNEYNTGISFDGTDLTVTDGGGNQSVDISGLDTDDQDIGTDGTAGNISIDDGSTLTLNVEDADANATNEIQTLTSTDGSVTLTQTGDDYDLSVTSADGSETIVNGAGINVVTGDGTSGNPYVVTGTEVDGDITNEIQTLTSTDGSVTLTQTGDDYNLSVAAADGTETVVQSGNANVTVSGDGSTGNPYSISSTDNVDDADANPNNEIQTITSTDGSVTLTQTGNDYNLSVAAADGTETIVNAGTNVTVTGDGSVATPYVVGVASLDDADSNPINEMNTSFDVSGGNLNITDANSTLSVPLTDLDSELAQTVTTGNTIATHTNASGTSTDILETVTDLTLETDGSFTYGDETGTDNNIPLISPNANNDIDVDASGRLYLNVASVTISETITDITGTLPTGNSIGIYENENGDLRTINETVTTLATADNITYTYTSEDNTTTSFDGTDDQSAAEVSFNDTTAGLGETDVQGAIEALAGSSTDSQTLTTDSSPGNVGITGGNTITLNVDDADSVVGNEYNTGISFDGTDLTVTDGGGNQSVDISGLDTDDQDIGTDGTAGNISIDEGSTLTLNVNDADANPNNEIQTLTSTDGSVSLIQTSDDYDLSVAAADGSETVVNGAGINTVTGNGTSGNPYIVTGTEVDGDITNEIQTITSTDGSVTLTQTGDDYNLSVAAADGTETVVQSGNANVTVTGDGSSGNPYQISSTDNVDDADSDPANEIQSLGIAGDQLSITGGNTITIPSADGSETVVNSGTDINVTGTGTTGNPYVVNSTFTEVDGDIANEIQTLTSTDGSVTLTQTGNDYNLSVAAADGSETIVNGAGINTVTGNGTSGNPYIVTGTEVDGDITNEIQTLTSTDGSVTLTQTGNDYNLSVAAADGTETVVQSGNANVTVTGDGSTGNPYSISSTDNVDDADANPTNEIQTLTSTDGSVTLTQTGDDYNLSVAAADGTETVVQSGNANVTVTGDGSSGDPYRISSTDNVDDADSVIGNEYNTGISFDGTDLTVTDGGGNQSVDISGLDTDDQDIGTDGTAGNISIDDGSTLTLNVDDADANATNEIQTLTSTDGSVSLTQTGDDYDLSVTAADGTETVVQSGNANVTVTGDGSTGNPYLVSSVDNVDDADANASNELQTLSQTGTDVTLSDGGGTVSVADNDNDSGNEIQTVASGDGSVAVVRTGDDFDLSVTFPTNNDNDPNNEIQTLSQTGTNVTLSDGGGSISVADNDNDSNNEIQSITSTDGSVALTQTGNDYNLSVAAADGSETIVNGAGINAVTGDGTSGNPYVVTGTEVDGDITNEIQTLTSTDGSVTLTQTGDDYNLSVAAADGTETVVQSGNANVTVTGDGSTGNPYLVSSVDNVNDADSDPNNEDQTVSAGTGISVSQTGDDFQVTNTAPDQTVSLADGGSGNVTIGGTYPNFTIDVNSLDDADPNPSNEIQDLQFNSGVISLTNDPGATTIDLSAYDTDASDDFDGQWSSLTGVPAGFADNIDNVDDADNDVNNEIQDLSLSGNILSLSGDATTVNLGAFTNTDAQTIDLTSNTLTLGNGTGADTTADLIGYLDNTDNQQISLSGNTLTLENGTGANTSVNLSGFVNTDDQDISTNGNPGNISIDSGSTLNLNVNDADSDPNNEDQTVSAGTGISVSQTGDDFQVTNAAPDQTVSLADGGSGNVTVGGTYPNFTIDVASLNDADSNPSNEIQVLGRTGTNVTLTNGGGSVSIADNDNDSGNEIQTLTSTDGSVTLTNTSDDYNLSVNFPANNDNSATNELSDLNLASDILTLTNPATPANQVDLSPYLDNTDDQFDDEVELRTPIDVDDAGKIPAEVVEETTVQEVIQAIAPITSKAARIFYPPSIAVDASSTGTGRTIDLYAQYTAQFATPAVASAGAPAAIPTYAAGDLYYYVTFFDTSVFDNVSVDATGVMTYDVIAQPTDYNSLINVVFVVK